MHNSLLSPFPICPWEVDGFRIKIKQHGVILDGNRNTDNGTDNMQLQYDLTHLQIVHN